MNLVASTFVVKTDCHRLAEAADEIVVAISRAAMTMGQVELEILPTRPEGTARLLMSLRKTVLMQAVHHAA